MSMITEHYKNYTIKLDYDQFGGGESPDEWGNYEIVTFNRGLSTDLADADWHKYATDTNRLTPAIQAKMKAGKVFGLRYSSHGPQCRYDAVHGPRTHVAGIDGLIIFTDEYAKNFDTYEGRYEMACSDLETYTQWANGDIWTAEVIDPYGDPIEDDGFMGDIYGSDAALDFAKQAIDADIDWHGHHLARKAHRAQELHR